MAKAELAKQRQLVEAGHQAQDDLRGRLSNLETAGRALASGADVDKALKEEADRSLSRARDELKEAREALLKERADFENQLAASGEEAKVVKQRYEAKNVKSDQEKNKKWQRPRRIYRLKLRP